MREMLAFFVQIKTFSKGPLFSNGCRKSGVCCYHGDSMAMTPETTFLTTFQTVECVSDSRPHRTPSQSVSLNYQLLIQWCIVTNNGEKLSSISLPSCSLVSVGLTDAAIFTFLKTKDGGGKYLITITRVLNIHMIFQSCMFLKFMLFLSFYSTTFLLLFHYIYSLTSI